MVVVFINTCLYFLYMWRSNVNINNTIDQYNIVLAKVYYCVPKYVRTEYTNA